MKKVVINPQKRIKRDLTFEEMIRRSRITPSFRQPPYFMTAAEKRYQEIRKTYPIGSELLIGPDEDYSKEIVSGYELYSDKMLVVFESGSKIDVRRIEALRKG